MAQARNTMMTWILRLVGFVLMGAGIFLAFKPIVVLADVVPVVGDLLSMGVGLFAFVMALALSLITISIGWLYYRPLVGVPLMAVAVGGLVSLYLVRKKRRAVA